LQSLVEWNRDASKDQRTAVHESMQIVSVADPHGRGSVRARAEQTLGNGEIGLRGDLQIRRVASHETNAGTGAFDQRRFIRRIAADGERFAEDVDAERLGGLREINLLAWQRG